MLLEEIRLLQEKLGNLAQLKAGKLINLFKQYEKNNDTLAPIGNRFNGLYYSPAPIGPASKILDIGPIKGIGDIRKAYRPHADTATPAQAFALYVDGKIVALGKFDSHDLAGTARTGHLAFDFTPFKDKLEAAHQAELDKIDPKDTWRRNRVADNPPKLSSHRSEKKNKWDDKDESMEHYQGDVKTVKELASFIQEVVELADGKPVTMKVVLRDAEIAPKRQQRRKAEVKDGPSLADRLKTYKLGKKPSASTIADFVKQITGSSTEIQFDGDAYSPFARSNDNVSPRALLRGDPFTVSYQSAAEGRYNTLVVFYVFNPDTGVVKPFKATWRDKDGKPKIEFLDHEMAIKHDLKAEHNKDAVIKSLLTFVKTGADPHAMHNRIKLARDAGYGGKELDIIEKSINKPKETE